MKLIEVKCPNCNSSLNVDNSKKKIECEYCGANFFLDDDTIKVKHLHAGQISEEQEFINAETNLNKLKNYEDAYNTYLSLSKRYVDNPEVWIGLLRSLTRDFKYKSSTYTFKEMYEKYWNNFKVLADKKDIEKYEEKYIKYIEEEKVIPIYSNNTLENKKEEKEKSYLLVTYFLGIFGVHRFLRKDYKMGFIYFFTFGLFGIGWLYDMIMEIKKLFKK